jgi:hypothetical protein
MILPMPKAALRNPTPANIEHPVCQDDEEDVDGALQDEVGCHERYDQPESTLVGNGAESAEQLADHPRCCDASLGHRRGTFSLHAATRKAEHSSAPAATRKTVPGPDTPSSTPARAGPPNTLKLSIQPAATLAAVSSSGVRASDGSSAPCVGLVSVRLRDTRATRV